MYAIFVQLVKDLESLIHKPHVLVVLSLTGVENNDHCSVEGLLSDGPAYEDCWIAVGKEEEGLQKLHRAVDNERTTTDGSLMMKAVSTAST